MTSSSSVETHDEIPFLYYAITLVTGSLAFAALAVAELASDSSVKIID